MVVMAPTKATVYLEAGNAGAMVHGDTSNGEVDISFKSVLSAATFAHYHPDWAVDIREGDSITSLGQGVVLTVRLDTYTPASPDPR
jgi:hypothetical protein